MPAFRRAFLLIVLGSALVGLLAGAVSAAETTLKLPTYQVQGNPVEDFGFRISPDFDSGRRSYAPVVDFVLPNTAAERAGIRPGDRIIAADGQPTFSGSRSLSAWRRLQQQKWNALKGGTGELEWTLEIEAPWTAEWRSVVLRLPIEAPRWGAPVWQPPPSRVAPTAIEPGPLAVRAREVWDSGVWMLLRGSYVRGFGFTTDHEHPNVLGYTWTLWDERGGHRLFVTQQRGSTEIVLEFIARANHRFNGSAPTESPDPSLASERTVLGSKAWAYLTTPEGTLKGALRLGSDELLLPADAQPGFEEEKTFWLDRAAKVSERWPLELVPGNAKR